MMSLILAHVDSTLCQTWDAWRELEACGFGVTLFGFGALFYYLIAIDFSLQSSALEKKKSGDVGGKTNHLDSWEI